jgi:V8-like Glu-specific endopeptidase
MGTGCANETADSRVEARVTTGTSNPNIFGGDKDDDGEALAGVVALRVGSGSTFELCSGALIAPNAVLTARHCVTKTLTTSVSCDENGNSANGKHVNSDQDPADIGVYVGSAPTFAKPAASKVRAIVAPTGPYLCDSDIAIVVLDTPITDIAPLAVRIHSSAQKGEMIRSVGYGQNDKASPIGTRFRKSDVSVLMQGKAVSPSKTPLGAHEFEVGKSICQGDSGGPAISQETGAVIGVVSRGGDCDEDFGHIYTTTAGFEDMFNDAFAIAGGAPIDEKGDVASSSSTHTSSAKGGSDNARDSAGTTGGCSIGTPSRASFGGTAGLGLALAAVLALSARRRRAR